MDQDRATWLKEWKLRIMMEDWNSTFVELSQQETSEGFGDGSYLDDEDVENGTYTIWQSPRTRFTGERDS